MAKELCIVTTDMSKRELKQHGEAAFPVEFGHGNLKNTIVIWHWHEEWELIFSVHGACVAGAGETTLTLGEGEGCFIKPGVLHNVWEAAGLSCEYRNVVFHPRLVGSIDSIFWQNYIQPLASPDFPQMIPFLKQDNHEFLAFFSRLWQTQEEKADGYEIEVRYLLTKFAKWISSMPAENRRPSEHEIRDMERMKAMISFIEAHYAQEMTLEQIAGSACISATECMRCFRRSIGTSPIRFLKESRLRHAAGMLCSSQEGISAIAAACGFFDMSYFARTFRQAYGMTPTEYREQCSAVHTG